MYSWSVFEDALSQLKKAIEYTNLDTNLLDNIIELLSVPQRQIEVNFPLLLDNGKTKIIKGYRVQHNNWLGPFKGGLRFHKLVNLDEIKTLAFWMTIKNAILNLPFGGGKGGLEIDPKILSQKELERLTRQFTRQLAPNIGPHVDVPAPDINTNAQIMDWLVDEYSKIVGNYTPAVVTGKSVDNGGSVGREEATGLGGFYVMEQLVKQLRLKKPLTVAISGFGNVGSHLAQLLFDHGYKIVALSDSKGGIYDREGRGFNVDLVRQCKLEKGLVAGCYCIGSVCDLTPRKDGLISNDKLLQLPVDILVPAALENVLTTKNAFLTKAKIILEMANGPITPKADQILEQKGVIIVPDVLANAGGVTVSYFEWWQNIKKEKWSLTKVHTELKKKMIDAFDKVWRTHQTKKVSLRSAAYIWALQRLSQGTAKFGFTKKPARSGLS